MQSGTIRDFSDRIKPIRQKKAGPPFYGVARGTAPPAIFGADAWQGCLHRLAILNQHHFITLRHNGGVHGVFTRPELNAVEDDRICQRRQAVYGQDDAAEEGRFTDPLVFESGLPFMDLFGQQERSGTPGNQLWSR